MSQGHSNFLKKNYIHAQKDVQAYLYIKKKILRHFRLIL